jgi:nucleotide-binding universal stress UspA family protein
MKRIRKILVPIDFSPGSRAAWDAALSLSRTLHGFVTLELLHVWEGDEQKLPDLTLRADKKGTAARLLAEARAHGLSLEHIAEFMTELENHGVEIVARMRRGDVVDTIVRTAVQGEFDLMVVGMQGRGRIPSLRIGSTAAQVVALSPIPVLTAPAQESEAEELAP